MLLELLLAATSCAPPQASGAVGLWELPAGSSGIGRAIELREDGTFIETMAVIVDLTYRVSANSITVSSGSAGDGRGGETMPFKATERVLEYRNPKRGKVKMTRVGTPPALSSLVQGVWRYRHYTGGTAFEKYGSDGRLQFRLPFPGAQRGCYTASEDLVSLAYPEGPVGLRRAGSNLLRQGDDDKHAFERARAGAWYPLTAIDDP